MLRLLDLTMAIMGLIIGLPVFIGLMIIGLIDTGSPLFLQIRVGRYQKPFTLVKFRTMKLKTVSVATHLVDQSAITPIGRLLRKTKLDELPQLWNVLKGEMSLVGPRPCLFNQIQLIDERKKRGVFDSRPGITGLSQVNRINMSKPRLLAKVDSMMLGSLTFCTYWKYILLTLSGKGSGDQVRE